MCNRLWEEPILSPGVLKRTLKDIFKQVAKPNLSKQESIGLAQLKKDKDRVVLTVDKGVAMVVMDKKDYIQKAESLLAQPAYRTTVRDPNSKIKAKLINTLKKIKRIQT